MDIKVKEEYLIQAVKMHREKKAADAHLDLAGEILLRQQAGEREIIKNHYLDNWRKAGIGLVVSSVYVPDDILQKGEKAAWENALAQIEALKEDMKNPNEFILVKSSSDMDLILETGKIGIILYMEGLDVIGEDVDKLSFLYEQGVRGASLTWSRKNALASGCCKALEHKQIPGGLTHAGIRAVKKLESLSMFLDVSHLNDEGFEQVCRIRERSFIATHSGSRQIYDSYRNLTDKQMAALAGQGGVMGMNGCKYIAGSLKGNHLEMLCRHIEHEVEMIGSPHVGYGFDLCDSYDQARAALKGEKYTNRADCLPDHGQMVLVTAALLQRGMPEAEAENVMGKSFIDYFRRILPEAEK